MAELGLTELGDIVGQATETCSWDKHTDSTAARMSEPRTEQVDL